MQKQILSISILSFLLIVAVMSCKKSSKGPATNGNVAHALSDSFYIRGLMDTTWFYTGNDNKDECQINGGVCSSFLISYSNGAFQSGGFTLVDMAHPNPKDTTILSWVGKTFMGKNDTANIPSGYTFTFSYPDSTGRTLSSDYVANNTGAKFTVSSVTYDGLTTHTFDSITPYKMYKVKGTFNCKVSHYGDTIIHNITQGVYLINVIEAK